MLSSRPWTTRGRSVQSGFVTIRFDPRLHQAFLFQHERDLIRGGPAVNFLPALGCLEQKRDGLLQWSEIMRALEGVCEIVSSLAQGQKVLT